MLHAMIMAGGGGTRFWPRSRQARPKQFLSFSGDRTLLQGTVDRIAAQVPAERTWVLTSEKHRVEAIEQLKGLVPSEQVVGEPVGRDTAACIGLGAALVAKTDPDATLIVMPADHAIEPAQEFRRAVHAAEQFATDFPDSLLTFGIKPTFPATGYGYIHRGENAGTRQGVPISRVLRFKEKPKDAEAEEFVASGDYFWNSGIFVWKPATILSELQKSKPLIHSAVLHIATAWGSKDGADVFRSEYEKVEAKSIDYAVMQDAAAAGHVLVMHAPYQWDDVGSWLALERRNPQDAAGNTLQALHAGVDTSNCVIVSDAEHLIGTLAVDDLVIIQSGNATLITTRKGEARVKELVDKIKAMGLGRLPVSEIKARGRLLGIDFGTVRIGLAISDSDRIVASPLATYTRKSEVEDAAYFKKIVADSQVVALVLGLPLHSDGNESDLSRAARDFGEWLVGVTNLPVDFWDERFTTARAEEALIGAKLNPRERKERRDKVAAQMILQAYLEADSPQ